MHLAVVDEGLPARYFLFEHTEFPHGLLACFFLSLCHDEVVGGGLLFASM